MSAERRVLSDLLSFPVDLPLTVTYDTDSGELSIEATVLRHGELPVLVRLDLSAEVAGGLIQGLREVDDHLGLAIGRYRPERLLQ